MLETTKRPVKPSADTTLDTGTGTPGIHKKGDLDHWAKLEAASRKDRVPSVKGRTIPGLIVRTQALEWLRLESIRLAYKRSPELFLRTVQLQDHDIRHAFGRDRDQLIEWPPREVGWVFPYRLPILDEAFAFYVLPDELNLESVRQEHQSGRKIATFDPARPTLAMEAMKKYFKKLRKDNDGKRASGAGLKNNLLRLREALLCYEDWLARAPIAPRRTVVGPHIYWPTQARDKTILCHLGGALRSYRVLSENDTLKREKNARDILGIAREMLQLAVPFAGNDKPARSNSKSKPHHKSKSCRKPLGSWALQYR